MSPVGSREPFVARLSLSLLGPFEARVDGRPVHAFRSQKACALLAYLAAEAAAEAAGEVARAHPRPMLAGMLWPDLPDASATANLRTALWNLRDICDDREAASPIFLVSRNTIGFNRDAPARVDLHLFLDFTTDAALPTPEAMNWMAIGRLEEAVALYRGPFLAGFFVDSAPFEEWVLLRQEQTQQRLLGALRYLAAAYEAKGDYDRALAHVQRRLEVNPWEEEAHRQAMRLLALSGRRGAALTQYERCRHVLSEELGIEPAATTQALAMAIREGEMAPPASLPGEGRPALPLQPPAPATPILGRDAEIAAITGLLDDGARLLSVVGPGGIGKTRLAMEVAQRLAPTFAGGAAIVELASISEPEAIVGAIAGALQLPLPGQGWSGLNVALRRQLRHRGLLLVLDNFEHLLDEAPPLIPLLEAAPGLRVVVTSRERLKLQAEQVVPLQGLGFSRWDTVADAERDPAVQLFLHHARQVRPSFGLRHEHLAPLRAILESVEGMPLGLILAAAWVEVMGLAEIAAEIRSSLDFLEAPYRDLPPRQRSMRALLESTWVRLDRRERRLFAGLAVFRAGFTTLAAQEVTGATARDLRRFVDRSMLARAEGGRFAMHQLWRQFAAGELSRSPEEETEMRERHAVYYARFLGQRSAAFKDERAEQAGVEIAAEFENARAAWNWAADRGRVSLLEQGLILGFYCIRQGRLLEGAVMSRRAAEALTGADSGPERRLLGFLLAAYVSFTDSGMPPADVRETLAEARAHLAAAGDLGEDVRYEKAFVLMIWGQLLILEDYLKAREVLAESLSLFEAVEAWFEAANVTSALARSYQVQRDYKAALAYAGKALRLWERIGERHWISFTRMQLGVIQTRLGRIEQGVDAIRESLALFSAAGNEYFAAQAQVTLGDTLIGLGRFDEALSLLSRGHAYFSGIDMADMSRAAWCWAALHQGHYDEAQRQARVLPANQGDIGAEAAISELCLLQGCAALALGNVEEAVSLLQTCADGGETAGAEAVRLSQILALLGSALALTGATAAAEGPIVEALSSLPRPYTLRSAATVLSAVSLLLAERGAAERALAIYEAARGEPYVANSLWFDEVFGRRLAEVATSLAEETVSAARERGRALAWRELVEGLRADAHSLRDL